MWINLKNESLRFKKESYAKITFIGFQVLVLKFCFIFTNTIRFFEDFLKHFLREKVWS